MTWRATILGAFATLGMMASSAGMAENGGSHEGAWLRAHNEARAEFGVAPLRWNPRLAAEARGWAERLAREEVLRHSSYEQRGGRGENLWMGTAGYYNAAQMIGFFNAEKRHFRPGEFPQVSRTGNWADVGHYTQIIWADTREVGCALARGRRFDALVCRYWPAGNVSGTYLTPPRDFAQR